MARRFGLARRIALDTSPLRDSVPYRALWIGQIVSLLGSQIRYIAVPYQVYRITGSVLAVGMIGLAEVAPLIAFSIRGRARGAAVLVPHAVRSRLRGSPRRR